MKDKSIQILLVEDDDAHSELISRVINGHSADYQLHAVDNLDSAYQALHNQTFHLLITDFLLPDGKGLDLINIVKQLYDLPIILMTSHGDENIAVEAIKAGALDYVVKSQATFLDMPRIIERALREWGYINDKRIADEKLRQAAVVIQNTSEGVMVTDTQMNITAVNQAFTEITGYQENDVLGKNPSILSSGNHDTDFYTAMWQSITETTRWQGEIWNRRKNGDIYPQLLTINTILDEDNNPSHYVGIFTDISKIKNTEAKLVHLAHHDPLTGLPNRLLLNARLEQALSRAQRESNQVAVIFLDLDRFKNINDSLGHSCGDRLLKVIAERLKQHIRKDDTVARLGGDEFVIILESINNINDIVKLADNMLKIFNEPVHIDEHEIFINTSMGISIFPINGIDAETLLQNADAAMYRAKERGRHNYQFYTDDLTIKARERLSIETDLRKAIKREEFELYYQPQVSLINGKIIGVEALIRWNHPEHGILMPDHFIPVAEDTGLIIPIGEWVMNKACEQQSIWLAAGYPPLRMSINLSARQFLKHNLVNDVRSILDYSRLDPRLLEFEITESVVMHDVESSIKTMQQLDEMGIELAIDDFGTGYSSLTYMKKFPINRLKIDQSFIKDITIEGNDKNIILSIIALGHSMGLNVIAEGVENYTQQLFLQQHDCDEAQGFLYSQPTPPTALNSFLKQEHQFDFNPILHKHN